MFFRYGGEVRVAISNHKLPHYLVNPSAWVRLREQLLQVSWNLTKESASCLLKELLKMEIKGPGTLLQLRSSSPIYYSASTLNMLGDIVHFFHPKYKIDQWMEILSSELWGPVTSLFGRPENQRTKNSTVKGRDPQLIYRAGLCKHFALSRVLLLYLQSATPPLRFILQCSCTPPWLQADCFFIFIFARLGHCLSFLKQRILQPLNRNHWKDVKIYIWDSPQNTVFRLNLRAEHSPGAWDGSTTVWEALLAVAVTQTERLLG